MCFVSFLFELVVVLLLALLLALLLEVLQCGRTQGRRLAVFVAVSINSVGFQILRKSC